MYTQGFKPLSPRLVLLGLVKVDLTIKLNDQPALDAEKVRDEPANFMLSPKI